MLPNSTVRSTVNSTGHSAPPKALYDLLLTLDLTEHILKVTGPKVLESADLEAEFVKQQLGSIQNLVEQIPLSLRLQHPHVGWTFLKNLSALIANQNIDKYVTWKIITKKLIEAQRQLLELIYPARPAQGASALRKA